MVLRLTFISFLTLFVLQAFAQITLPPFKQYTLREGLSQMQVLCMLQDSRGYIWIGTKGGLNYFNGEKFVQITRKNGLSDDYINQIIEDKSGGIWFSTRKGIGNFDGAKVIEYPHEKLITPSIVCDSKGKIWYFGCDDKNKGYFGYLENGHYKSMMDETLFKDTKFIPASLQYISSENRFVFSCYKKWYSYCNGKFEFIGEINYYFPFLSNKQRLYLIGSYEYDRKIFEIVNGKLILRGIVKNGKYVYKPMLKDTIRVINYAEAKADEYSSEFCREFTLENLVLSATITDTDGNVWYGTEEGLFQIFDEAFTTYSRQHLPMVWGITEDKQGDMWFASFNFGIKRLSGDKITEYKFQDSLMNRNFYFHPTVDKRGTIYFPGYNGMLVSKDGSFYQEKQKPCICSFYDSEKDLLFTGDYTDVRVYDKDLLEVKRIGKERALNVGNHVLAINKDIDGNYWFGGGRGLACYNWQTDKLNSYDTNNGKFRTGGVWVIHKDFCGRCWFGTKDGLYWYDNKADTLRKFESEVLTGSVNLLASVDSTWLIASQPYGIYLIDLQKYYKTGITELYLFNEKNGFQGIEPGQDGGFTDSEGNVWMTTSTELVKLNPRILKPRKHFLNIRIAKLDGNPLSFNTEKFELPRNQNSAVLTFDAICLNRPNPVQYSWKIGNDTVWSAWQEDNYIVISGLKDGLTKIAVKAKIVGLPLVHIAQTGINLQVRIAIYRQEWFFPSIFLLISLIGSGFLVYSLLQAKRVGKEAKIFQMQAIQSQMNPHFIFNALASLQSMILKNNIIKANDYLVKLAELIRGFLEASAGTGIMKHPESNEGQVSIADELALLKEYVEFQQVINPNRFDYAVYIDDSIDSQTELIPPLLIQPFVENSIRHGLLPSKNKGLLSLSFKKTKELLIIEIQDNGVGIEKAQQMLVKSPMRYISRGTELTVNRIKLLNQLGFKIEIETYSTSENTKVIIKLHK